MVSVHLSKIIVVLYLIVPIVIAIRGRDGFLGSSRVLKANTTANTTSFQKSQIISNVSSHRNFLEKAMTTTTPKPIFPTNPWVGSVATADRSLTMQVITEGFETAMEKFKKANSGLAKLTCQELDEKRADMDTAWADLRDRAMQLRFEAAKANAKKKLEIREERVKHEGDSQNRFKDTLRKSELVKGTRDENVAARETVKDYEKYTVLHLNVLEQYALKCGVKDKWCEIGDVALNDKFAKIQKTAERVDSIFTEAGWLRNEALKEYSTQQSIKAYKLRWGDAVRTVEETWAQRKSLTYGLEVTTAACGTRPPPGAWNIKQRKCDMKPQDPQMKALLRDDPQEFNRRWKELIGKKAGVTPDKVVVRTDC